MKRVPPAILLGLAISALFIVVELVHQLVPSDIYSRNWIKWSLAGAGGAFAYKVIAIYGLRELARGHGGRVALGANIAIAGIVIALSTSIAFDVLTLHEHWLTQSRSEILYFAFSIAAVVEVVGFAIAARVSRPTGIGVVVFGVIAHPPRILARPIYEALALGETSSGIVHWALQLVSIAMLIALAVVACRDRAPSPAPQCAIEGLRRASSSFWLRLIAALAIPAATLLYAFGGGRDAETIMRVAVMTSAFAGLIALAVFAVGAVRASQAGIADLNGIALLVGGTLALWCAGVGLQELPTLYRMLYDLEDRIHYHASAEQVFPILLPLVGIAAVTAVVTAIHRFAVRRAFADLIRQAAANGTWFVAFSLTSIAVQNWLLPNVQTSSGGVVMVLILALSGIVTNVAMARLCEQAANAIDREASLPTATVISGPA